MPYGPSRSTQGINADKQPVQFTLADAQRIGYVVSQVERERRDRRGSTLPRAAGSGGSVRLGTISATWNKAAIATVREQDGNGADRLPATTFTAKNYFATVTVSGGTKRVACSRVDDVWILIAGECD